MVDKLKPQEPKREYTLHYKADMQDNKTKGIICTVNPFIPCTGSSSSSTYPTHIIICVDSFNRIE